MRFHSQKDSTYRSLCCQLSINFCMQMGWYISKNRLRFDVQWRRVKFYHENFHSRECFALEALKAWASLTYNGRMLNNFDIFDMKYSFKLKISIYFIKPTIYLWAALHVEVSSFNSSVYRIIHTWISLQLVQLSTTAVLSIFSILH